ncbi:hypothetical protein U1Q18_006251 [Sarracenia purpurea var. burkii]
MKQSSDPSPATSAGESFTVRKLWAAPLLSALLLLDTVVCSSAPGFLLVLNSFQALRPPEAPSLRIIVNGENNHQIRSNSDRSEPINPKTTSPTPRRPPSPSLSTSEATTLKINGSVFFFPNKPDLDLKKFI